VDDKVFDKALNYAFVLLKYRDRSRSEIASRLKKKRYSLPVIQKVIQYLKEYNYVDDERFVRAFVAQSLDKGWGPRRIDYNLRQLGIPQAMRRVALSGIDPRERIREFITRKMELYGKKRDISSQKMRQRIVRFLAAKGFDYQDIFQEMNDLEEGTFEDR
jgi:regulatory protein